MIGSFQFQGPATQIVFGEGVAAQLGTHAATLGMRRALLVTDAGLAQSAACQAAQESLAAAGVQARLFAEVVLDPSDLSVEAAAARYRSLQADGIVALGGGSAMDSAKALGVLIGAGAERIAPFYFGGSATPQGLPPLICLPTTAGTGAETTFVAVVTEHASQRKLIVRHPSMAPALALVDPLLSASMPPALTAFTGMDALAHALEGMTSSMASPISDALALEAIPRIFEALPRAVAGNDAAARHHMSYAALVAGMAFLSGRVHLGHAVGHSLGSAFHVPHGLACIVCMPAILEFIAQPCAAQCTRIAHSLNLGGAADLPAAVAELMQRCAIPRLAAALKVEQVDVGQLVELVQGEQRLIGLSLRRPSDAEWAAIFAASI